MSFAAQLAELAALIASRSDLTESNTSGPHIKVEDFNELVNRVKTDNFDGVIYALRDFCTIVHADYDTSYSECPVEDEYIIDSEDDCELEPIGGWNIEPASENGEADAFAEDMLTLGEMLFDRAECFSRCIFSGADSMVECCREHLCRKIHSLPEEKDLEESLGRANIVWIREIFGKVDKLPAALITPKKILTQFLRQISTAIEEGDLKEIKDDMLAYHIDGECTCVRNEMCICIHSRR